MSKKFYETPQCEAFEMVLQNVVLQGSPTTPGDPLVVDDPFDFGSLGF